MRAADVRAVADPGAASAWAPCRNDVSHAVIAASRHCRLGDLRITSRQLMPFVDHRARPGRRCRAGRRARRRVACAAPSRWGSARAPRARRRSTSRSWAAWRFTGPTSPSLTAILLEPGRARPRARHADHGRGLVPLLLDHGDVARPSTPRRGSPARAVRTSPGRRPPTARASPCTGRSPTGPRVPRASAPTLGGDRLHDRLRDVHAVPAADEVPALAPGNEPTRYQALQIDLRNLAPSCPPSRSASPATSASASRPGSSSRRGASASPRTRPSTALTPGSGARPPVRRREPAGRRRATTSPRATASATRSSR